MNNIKSQSGFTLIEMIAVIIILAIMAATALPKFVNLSADARKSAIEGLAGGLRSAAVLSRSTWLVAQSGTQAAISMAGVTVTVFNAATTNSTPSVLGFPTADGPGIVYALDNTTGFESSIDPTGYGWRFAPTGVATSATCYADYYSGIVFVSATALGCS